MYPLEVCYLKNMQMKNFEDYKINYFVKLNII